MKAAVGCAIGCGVLALVGLVAAGVGGWWLVAPGEQRPTAAVISPAAAGAFHVGDLGADPGTTALLDRFILESQRQQQQGMPPWLAEMQRASARTSSPSSGFRMLLPREATIAVEQLPGGDAAPVVALNARGLTRLFDILLRQGEQAAGSHRDHALARLGAEAWGAMVGGTFVFATEEAALRAGIDRLLDGEAAPAAARVELPGSPRDWDVTGVMANDDGTVDRFLWEDGGAPEGLRRASFGVDLATGDMLAGRLVADCESAAAADETLRALHDKLAEEAPELAARSLELRAAFRAEESRAIVDWEVHGLAEAVARWVADVATPAALPEPDTEAGGDVDAFSGR
jgi:hypothetical protein